MFLDEDKRCEESKDDAIVSEEEKITFGISHIIATFFATLIGSILGFHLAHIW